MNTISITEKEHLFFERASTEKPSLILISDSNWTGADVPQLWGFSITLCVTSCVFYHVVGKLSDQ